MKTFLRAWPGQPRPLRKAASRAADEKQPGIGQLLQSSSLYLVGNIATKILGFAMIPFYSHALNTAQYGALNLLDLAITIVATVFGLQSIGAALVRVYHDQDGDALRRRVVATALIGSTILAALVGVLAAVAATPIANAAGLAGQAHLIRLALLGMFLSSISDLLLTYLRMRGRARFYLAFSMTNLVFTLALNILLIGYAHLGVWGFIIGKIAVTVAGDAFLLIYLWPEISARFHPALARAMLLFAAPLVVSGACTLTIHFSDLLFLAHVSRSDVAVYALAYSFAFLLSVLIGNSFGKFWNTRLYVYATEDGWQTRFAGIGRWLIFMLGVSATGISLSGRDIITIMAPAAYTPPSLLLPLLVSSYFLREIGEFFNSTLLLSGRSGLVGKIALAGAALNLTLNVLLIPPFGIWGAAWATFLCWAAYCATCWAFAWRVHKISVSPRCVAIMLALSASAVWLRSGFDVPNGCLGLALDFSIFCLFLVTASLLVLTSSERGVVLALRLRLRNTQAGSSRVSPWSLTSPIS